MKLELAYAKLRKGKAAKLTPLKAGALTEAGDVEIGPQWVTEIADSFVGKPVESYDCIARITFEP